MRGKAKRVKATKGKATKQPAAPVPPPATAPIHGLTPELLLIREWFDGAPAGIRNRGMRLLTEIYRLQECRSLAREALMVIGHGVVQGAEVPKLALARVLASDKAANGERP